MMNAIYQERRENGGSKLKGRKLPIEHRNNISKNHSRHNLGKKHSDEIRLKIKQNRGKPVLSEEGRKSIIEKQSKPVRQYDLSGNFISEYSSGKEAKIKTNINHIYSVCRGERKSAGGFKWEYI